MKLSQNIKIHVHSSLNTKDLFRESSSYLQSIPLQASAKYYSISCKETVEATRKNYQKKGKKTTPKTYTKLELVCDLNRNKEKNL